MVSSVSHPPNCPSWGHPNTKEQLLPSLTYSRSPLTLSHGHSLYPCHLSHPPRRLKRLAVLSSSFSLSLSLSFYQSLLQGEGRGATPLPSSPPANKLLSGTGLPSPFPNHNPRWRESNPRPQALGYPDICCSIHDLPAQRRLHPRGAPCPMANCLQMTYLYQAITYKFTVTLNPSPPESACIYRH